MGASAKQTGLGAPEGAEPHAGLGATPAIPSAAFTPGPWEVDERGEHPRYSILANRHVVLAKAWEMDDAHLIAAAPDLFAALLRAYRILDSYGEDADDAQAALSKAMGYL